MNSSLISMNRLSSTVIRMIRASVAIGRSEYSGGAHASAVRYLFFGIHGHHALVPYIGTAVALNVASAVLLLPRSRRDKRWLLAACGCAFFGVYLEKGLGLIVPGFVPSTLHELIEYTPTLLEWKISAGVWALGLIVLTVILKVGLTVWTGRLTVARESKPAAA